jgi:tetratricopeptide (TPR) repeat protein
MAKAGSAHEALAGLEPLKPVLQNAESFWRNYAYVQLTAHQFKQAEEALIKAGTLSSGPDIHYALGYCYEQSGAWGLAQKEYRLAICLEPQRLKPRYALMKLSFRTGDTAQMICMARQIMALPLKGNMQEARRYKQEAGKALRLKALTSSVKPL